MELVMNVNEFEMLSFDEMNSIDGGVNLWAVGAVVLGAGVAIACAPGAIAAASYAVAVGIEVIGGGASAAMLGTAIGTVAVKTAAVVGGAVTCYRGATAL